MIMNGIDKRYYKININGSDHIFTNVQKSDNHYLVNEVDKNGNAGEFVHRISQAEFDRAVIADTLSDLIGCKKSDYIFKAFIVNTHEYDNGNKETSGEWLYFPTTKDEVSAVFEKIGLPENASPDTYFFDNYACGNDDLKKCLTMYESIDALNYLANRISELEDIEMTVFQAVIQTKESQNIKDAINLTYNTECFDIISDMKSWENIGSYIAEREGTGIDVIGDLSNYIDYATYGRAYANDNGGYFLGDVYLERNSTALTEKYNGNIKTIPPEYAVTKNYLETAEKSEEQNYNQLDGRINNTDKKPSIKEQLKTISNEQSKSEPQQQRKPREETL